MGDEGIFEFGEVVSSAWPAACSGAYLCFLANPQNLDLASLVSSPTVSPFYKVLEAGPQMLLMVSNQNSVIHSRLWCVFEAYCAQRFEIPIKIAGDPLWLVPVETRAESKRRIQDIQAGN